MRKIYFLLTVSLFVIGCDKEDDCDCYYSEEFNQYFPHTAGTEQNGFEQNFINQRELPGGISYDRMDALDAECRNKGCD